MDKDKEEFRAGPYILRHRLPVVVRRASEASDPADKQKFSPKTAARSKKYKDTDKLLDELEEILKEGN